MQIKKIFEKINKKRILIQNYFKFKNFNYRLLKKQKSNFVIKNNFSKKGIKKGINRVLDKFYSERDYIRYRNNRAFN